MHCHSTVEGVMDCAAADVGSGYVSTQMKMDWVATFKEKRTLIDVLAQKFANVSLTKYTSFQSLMEVFCTLVFLSI